MIGVNKKLNRVQQEMQWTEICSRSNRLCRNWWVRYGEAKNLKPYDWDVFYGEGSEKQKIHKEMKRKLPPMEIQTSHVIDYPDYTKTLRESSFHVKDLNCNHCNRKLTHSIPCSICYKRH
ncbi:uncharacterized protein LOC118181848 isoform X2 [Stegodyphus dumicola]|uniref:uncharacterized protein LOC118181848 isoform X2 n=1 Tax=Stegodyphus dumicola TaxID=202533 RepID=UPI0015AD98E2|nr:uncharacterized protein LOC118181848 isoform X2 [Stegodyphus dumicola]